MSFAEESIAPGMQPLARAWNFSLVKLVALLVEILIMVSFWGQTHSSRGEYHWERAAPIRMTDEMIDN